jgi:hypothetical protein
MCQGLVVEWEAGKTAEDGHDKLLSYSFSEL